MLDKLELKLERYNFLSNEISKPEIIADNKEYRKLAKEQASLQPFVDYYNDYIEITKNLENAKAELRSENDTEIRAMLEDEIENLKQRLEKLEYDVKVALLPKDEDDEKNVILEIRGGAGGDEASLFAMELMRMYIKFAERNRFKVNVISTSETGIGGLKEGAMIISGSGVYSKFKYESGVHRVQRVPETESGGRIHTSTVTVAVLPEQEEVEVELDEKDLKIEITRSSNAGGQCVNTTDSAVKMTHIPTGIIVECQDERSQLQNREKALRIMKNKLYDFYKTQSDKEYAEKRKCQVGTGDRSERIRTYNFPQSRVTDHRINWSCYSINLFMEGDMGELVDALQKEEQKQLFDSIKA